MRAKRCLLTLMLITPALMARERQGLFNRARSANTTVSGRRERDWRRPGGQPGWGWRRPRAFRYKPTMLNDEDAADFCDPFGFCQGTLQQIEFAGGAVVRF
jgi:hypothetical protein